LDPKNRDKICVALDLADRVQALEMAKKLSPYVGVLKLGLELFVAEGPSLVSDFRALGLRIFLDLKLHDIPNTVRAAASGAGGLGVDFLTVHALGGRAMIAAALEGAESGASAKGFAAPSVVAVTVLTSHDSSSLIDLGFGGDPEAVTQNLAALAVQAGAGGLVCSPREVRKLRAKHGDGLRYLTPGVRPMGSEKGDQARTATPRQAIEAGADLVIIGRPILQAERPEEAAREILESL